MTKDDVLLSTGKAAAVLGVHPQTLRKYEADGRIKAVRTPGGDRRFKLADLEALVAPAEVES